MAGTGGAGADLLTSESWAGDQGDRWLAYLDQLEATVEAPGKALLTQAGYVRGERVVDVGCGGGWTTRRICEAVGPSGLALGLDISPALVAEARVRAQAAQLSGIAFQEGDAATAMPEQAPFDRIFSRFGVMFFPDPEAAFANLHAMLREGGRLDMAVWAPLSDNDWMREIMAVVGRYVELTPPEPGMPGPFSLSEPDHVRALLDKAGFTAIAFDLWAGDHHVGGHGASPEAAAEFAIGATHIGELARATGPEVAALIERDLVDLFGKHKRAEGVVLPAKAWLVHATG